MISKLNNIIEAFEIKDVDEVYSSDVKITDLKEELQVKGHVIVVRGDKSYGEKGVSEGNPKFWMYENLLNSKLIQEQLSKFPNHKLFDGVGFSGLEALCWHSRNMNKELVVVMAYEMIPDKILVERNDIEVICGKEPMEEGYVKKQAEVLSQRKDLIPLHQALRGARAMRPIGNKIAKNLEELNLEIDESYWCIASGANLYGIGGKLRERETKLFVVEPQTNITIPSNLDVQNSESVKNFALRELKDYELCQWNGKHSGIMPLHVSHLNRYLLVNWSETGITNIDGIKYVDEKKVRKLKEEVVKMNPDYNWSDTTFLSLVPAIESAKEGKNVLVMAYGKDKPVKLRRINIKK